MEVARACAVPSFSSAYWQEVEDGAALVGWAARWASQLGCNSQASGKAQVSVFPFFVFFSISDICF